MTMDEQMAAVAAHFAAERQNRLDVRELRQHDFVSGLDRVVEPQRDARMGVERRECRRLRPVRVENRQNVRDASGAVAIEFIEAADGQRGECRSVHGGALSTNIERGPLRNLASWGVGDRQRGS